MAGPSARTLQVGAAVTGVAAVGIALVTQHVFLGLLWRPAIGAVLGLLLAASGIAAALWQHFVAAASQSCEMTFADQVVGSMKLDSLWPDVFSARASCTDAAVNLVGVPYEFWSLALFIAIGVALAAVLRRPR